jgi:hypothetical protein
VGYHAVTEYRDPEQSCRQFSARNPANPAILDFRSPAPQPGQFLRCAAVAEEGTILNNHHSIQYGSRDPNLVWSVQAGVLLEVVPPLAAELRANLASIYQG